MKKKCLSLFIVTMFATFSLTACEKETTSEQSTNKEHLNPPSWIQFTWVKPNGLNGEDGFRFTTDDMFTVMYDANGYLTVDLSYMESISNLDYTVSEQSTGDTYQLSVYYSDTNSTELWQFTLQPNGELVYTDNNNSSFSYIKKD